MLALKEIPILLIIFVQGLSNAPPHRLGLRKFRKLFLFLKKPDFSSSKLETERLTESKGGLAVRTSLEVEATHSGRKEEKGRNKLRSDRRAEWNLRARRREGAEGQPWPGTEAREAKVEAECMGE